MYENGKQKFVWMPLILGFWYTFATMSYIANAKIGFNIPWAGAYVIGVILAIAYASSIIWYGNKRSKQSIKANN